MAPLEKGGKVLSYYKESSNPKEVKQQGAEPSPGISKAGFPGDSSSLAERQEQY